MRITVVGTGYVGLVTGTCFAETGNDVTCLDTDQKKVETLQAGEIPFYEPGLKDLVQRNHSEERIVFTSDVKKALENPEVIFTAVGTPSNPDGSADLQYIYSVADSIAAHAPKKAILTIKSTVPIGTNRKVKEYLHGKGRDDIRVVSNPEFLREGSAVNDCLFPDRVVIGTQDQEVEEFFRQLYAPYVRTGHPVLVMDIPSAEMTKYAANALLASRISFMNEVSMLCELVGADVGRVREGVGTDNRIGQQYLFPSVGFGGSCFPKDVRALVSLYHEYDLQPKIMEATLQINEMQKKRFGQKILDYFTSAKATPANTQISIWGLSFKAKTDDIRESPALDIMDQLLEKGFSLKVYDPVSIPNVRERYGDKLAYGKSPFDTLEGANALCVLTEWNQFRHPDFDRMKALMNEPIIFDGRNLYEPESMKEQGFEYFSVGR